MALIDELLVGLGFEYDSEEMDEFKEDVSKTTGVIKDLARMAVAGAAAITGLTIASTQASDEQGKLADEIGDSVENIDALQFALERSGGSADGMTSSLRSLSIRAAEAARGVGSGVEAFGLLGISAVNSNGHLKKSSGLMLEISQRFQGLNKSQQIELADKLGLSDSIRLLQQGPAAIRELTDEARALGVTTAEDAEAAAEFQDGLTNIWKIVKQVSRVLARNLVPMLKETNAVFIEWWKTNRSIIEQKLPEWIENATYAIKLLTIAAGAWIAMRLVSHVMSLITVMKGLSTATMMANASAMLIPALITAAIIAVGLLIDEIITFINGGESFIGDLVEQFPLLGTVVYAVVDAFKFLGEVANDVWGTIVQIIDAVKNFKLPESFTDAIDSIKNLKLPESFTDAIDSIKSLSVDGVIESIGDLSVDGVIESTGDFLSGLNPFGSDEPQTIPELGGNSVSNSSSVSVDKIEITIDGSGDPKAVADEVFTIFQQTSQDLNTAVDY
jgi:hypothetical protein